MAITYQIVEAGGTSTDLHIDADNMVLQLGMSYYKSGLHDISRGSPTSGGTIEEVVLYPDPTYDTRVTVYLLDDPVYGNVEEVYTETVWHTESDGQMHAVEEQRTRTINRLIENEGTFIIDMCRIGIDTPYVPEADKLVMVPTSFIIPKGFTGSLADLDIKVIKVV